MKRFVEFDDAALDQFEPKTREALLRIWRQQTGKDSEKPLHDPLAGFADLCQATREAFEKRVAEHQRPDGTVVAQCDLQPPKR